MADKNERAKPGSAAPLRYVVATERGARGRVPSVLARLADIDTIDIVGSANPDRVVVRALKSDIDKLTQRFGDTLFVEPEIMYPKSR